MRLLDRYLLRELLTPLGYCLCGFLLFWISSDLLEKLGQLQKRGLRPLDIAEYYLVALPEFLVLVLPIALVRHLLRGQHFGFYAVAGLCALPVLGIVLKLGTSRKDNDGGKQRRGDRS